MDIGDFDSALNACAHAQLLEVPPKTLILLVGPPSSGKSTFCNQTILRNIEVRSVMYVTTGSSPSKVLEALRQKGLGEVLSHSLGFVDAFRETVGRPSVARPDTVDASSGFDESRHRHLQAEGKVR